MNAARQQITLDIAESTGLARDLVEKMTDAFFRQWGLAIDELALSAFEAGVAHAATIPTQVALDEIDDQAVRAAAEEWLTDLRERHQGRQA